MAEESSKRKRGRPPSGGREAILAATLELLRERGIAKLTTREVAERAGVSEASIFYHYSDRLGLLKAVFVGALEPLQSANRTGLEGTDHVEVLERLAKGIEAFLEQALPVFNAAQSDTDLRESLAAYAEERDLGPHRGIELLRVYIAAEQEAGRMRADVDAAAAASSLVAGSYMRASQRLLMGHGKPLPSARASAVALAKMLEPTELDDGA